MTYCQKCRQYYWSDKCTCREFSCYYPEYYGEKSVIKNAKSFDDAVEQVASELHEDDHPGFDCDIFETPIEVTDDKGITKRFNCSASLSIDYNVVDLDEEED